MSKLGKIRYESRDGNNHFIYSFKISDYHAAQILQYIASIPHASTKSTRDNLGRFTSGNDLPIERPKTTTELHGGAIG